MEFCGFFFFLVCCLFGWGGVFLVLFFFFFNKERASASNQMYCTNSGMKENKECYCKIHLQVLNSDIEK